MTTQQFIQREKKFYELLTTKALPFKQAVYNTMALQAVRIFEKGKGTSGGLIGGGKYNSTSGLYVNNKLLRGGSKLGKPRGKPYNGQAGRTKFASTGQPHKLNYVTSYKALREKLGRRTDIVNLQLNYDLFSDWAGSPGSKSAPKNFKPTQLSVLEYAIKLTRNTNTLKVSGLEEKYGRIFAPTKDEKKNFYKSFALLVEQARQKFYAAND